MVIHNQDEWEAYLETYGGLNVIWRRNGDTMEEIDVFPSFPSLVTTIHYIGEKSFNHFVFEVEDAETLLAAVAKDFTLE